MEKKKKYAQIFPCSLFTNTKLTNTNDKNMPERNWQPTIISLLLRPINYSVAMVDRN